MIDKRLSVFLASALFLGVTNISFAAGTDKEPVILKAAEQREQLVQEVQEDLTEGAQEDSAKIKANKELLEKAQAEFDNKDFQSTIVHSTIYINSKPKKYEAYKLRGDAFYALHQFSLAEKDFQTAVDLKRADDKLMTGTKYVSAVILGADKNEQLQNAELGNLYGRLMYAKKAQNKDYEEAYNNAVKYNSHIYLPQPKKSEINMINCPQKYGKVVRPQGIDANIYGAIDDIEKEDYNEALYKLQKVTSEYPKYYQGYYLTGVALAGLEQYENAIHSFEKALEFNPYDFESMASLGQIYYNKSEISFSPEDSKKSTEYFKKAIKYNKNCNTYYFYIGLNELQNGNSALAVSYFDKALKLNSNDYNSMYYKAIAQYENGDYSNVIDGTTKLLYKHVSNYNSVQYLRALAYYKTGAYDKAIADLDNIQSSINDIYNSDVKVVTEKEKTLESYVYYLKDKISRAQGTGDRANLANAYKNPIIAKLAKAEESLAPYKKVLEGDSITLDDYKKFEDFYNTSLPKQLQSNILITLRDIDNQYDYIRTTFDDLGINFKYKNPDYVLNTTENYPYKKYSSKLPSDGLAVISESVPEDLKEAFSAPSKPELKSQTSQKEMLGDDSGKSLAQMLATNSLLNSAKPAQPKTVVKQDLSENLDSAVVKFEPQIPDAERVETSSNIASGEPFIYVDKPSKVDKENAQKVKEILKEEKAIEAPELKISNVKDNSVKVVAPAIRQTKDVTVTHVPVDVPFEIEKTADTVQKTATQAVSTVNGYKITAPEIKDSPNVTITYGDSSKKSLTELTEEVKKVPSKNVEQKLFEKNSEIIPANPEQTIAYKQAASVVEKYADINPMEYGIQSKSIPVIQAGDDVIELEQSSLLKDIETTLQTPQVDNVTFAKAKKSWEDALKNIQQDVLEPVTIKEEELPKLPEKEDIKVAVPVVEVPGLSAKGDVKVTIPAAESSSAKVETIPTALSLRSNTITTSEQPRDIMRGEYSLPVKSIVKTEEPRIASTEAKVQSAKTFETIQTGYLTKEQVQAEKEKIRENLKVQKQQLKEAQKQAKAEAKARQAAQKAEAKLLKEQQKAQAKADELARKDLVLRAKEENVAKEQEELLAQEIEKEKIKAQQELEKAQAKAKKEQEKLAAKALTPEQKAQQIKEKEEKKLAKELEKAKIKAQNEQAKVEAKIDDENEELKIAKVKAQTQEELSKAEKEAQKAQLKAERAQAKAEAKARKEAQKVQAKAEASAKKELEKTTKAYIKAAKEKNVSNVTSTSKVSPFKKFLSKFKRKK